MGVAELRKAFNLIAGGATKVTLGYEMDNGLQYQILTVSGVKDGKPFTITAKLHPKADPVQGVMQAARDFQKG